MSNLRHTEILVLVWSLSFIVVGVDAQAQSGTDIDSTKGEEFKERSKQQVQLSPKNELSVWLGFALDSFQLWGKTKDVNIKALGLRYNRKLTRYRDAIIEYNLLANLYSNYSYHGFEPYAYQNTLFGFGISPLGLQLNFFTSGAVQPFINTSTGIMFMHKPFPDNRGKKLNFTFGAGGGLEIMLSHSVSLSIGIRYHHLSNGERGQINPGVDSNLYYTSITFF